MDRYTTASKRQWSFLLSTLIVASVMLAGCTGNGDDPGSTGPAEETDEDPDDTDNQSAEEEARPEEPLGPFTLEYEPVANQAPTTEFEVDEAAASLELLWYANVTESGPYYATTFNVGPPPGPSDPLVNVFHESQQSNEGYSGSFEYAYGDADEPEALHGPENATIEAIAGTWTFQIGGLGTNVHVELHVTQRFE